MVKEEIKKGHEKIFWNEWNWRHCISKLMRYYGCDCLYQVRIKIPKQ